MSKLSKSTDYVHFEDQNVNKAIPWEELPSIEEINNFSKIVSFMITKKLGLSEHTITQLYCREGILN